MKNNDDIVNTSIKYMFAMKPFSLKPKALHFISSAQLYL